MAPPENFLEEISHRLVYSTANLQYDKKGRIDYEAESGGRFAPDLEGTVPEYNQPDPWGENPAPLCAAISSSTRRLDDSITFLKA